MIIAIASVAGTILLPILLTIYIQHTGTKERLHPLAPDLFTEDRVMGRLATQPPEGEPDAPHEAVA